MTKFCNEYGVCGGTRKISQFSVSVAVPTLISKTEVCDDHCIVGTPGTVLDLLRRKRISTEHLKCLVLDEADNMLSSQGLGEQSLRVRKYGLRPCVYFLLLTLVQPNHEPSTSSDRPLQCYLPR